MDNEIVNGKFFPALKHRDYDHAIPPGGTPPSVGGRAGSEVFLPVWVGYFCRWSG